MSVFSYILILGLFLFATLFTIFVWSIRSGQYDDLVTPAERALWEDPKDDAS